MQNAYASYQSTQLIGRFSWLPAALVQVTSVAWQFRFVSHVLAAPAPVATYVFQSVASQPVSYVPALPLLASPSPPFKCVWIPLPFDRRQLLLQVDDN
jgi:hypothetical protein